ncbi:IS110 family transposase [Streptococcus suis]|uniref:IS110 family transposase n=1 Tax=Streptococcus suis TaxID=1307 RepID=UPI0019615FC8|nr:transposase [Streptococcus suis]MBM7152912.1 transposase [Streptococcus suis]MDG4502704.1 IS110 family transposase [Streptococcus suis]
MKSVLSVDVAKGKSMIMLSTEYGEVLIEPKEIKHNFRDFNELKDKIESFNLEDLTIFMESTGIYHLPVERYFKENNFNTLVINSLTTKNNYDTLRKTKTDTKDCMRLAKLFFVNEVEYHDLSKKDLYANLKAMTRQYFYLTQLNVSCKNRYKRLINICFPEFEEIFKGSRIYEETALNFIKTFPHAYIVKEKRIRFDKKRANGTNRHDLSYKDSERFMLVIREAIFSRIACNDILIVIMILPYSQ